MNRIGGTMLWCGRHGAPLELAEVRGNACSHSVTGNCGANWHRMLKVPKQKCVQKVIRQTEREDWSHGARTNHSLHKPLTG